MDNQRFNAYIRFIRALLEGGDTTEALLEINALANTLALDFAANGAKVRELDWIFKATKHKIQNCSKLNVKNRRVGAR
tara:strand:+ start:509 stop:742 length:234 start_codon:yes stop_codon:yes gene_type:complete